MPTVPTFAVREIDVSRTANVGTVGMNGLTSLIVRLTESNNDISDQYSVQCLSTYLFHTKCISMHEKSNYNVLDKLNLGMLLKPSQNNISFVCRNVG